MFCHGADRATEVTASGPAPRDHVRQGEQGRSLRGLAMLIGQAIAAPCSADKLDELLAVPSHEGLIPIDHEMRPDVPMILDQARQARLTTNQLGAGSTGVIHDGANGRPGDRFGDSPPVGWALLPHVHAPFAAMLQLVEKCAQPAEIRWRDDAGDQQVIRGLALVDEHVRVHRNSGPLVAATV